MLEMQRTKESLTQDARESVEIRQTAPVSIDAQQETFMSVEARQTASAEARAPQFLPTQTRPLSAAPPPDPVFKGASKGGKLLKQKKEDIYATHSDRQRLGVKGVIADNAAIDLRSKTLTRELRRILTDIAKYGAMDVTAKSSKEALEESKLLAKIRGDLAEYMGRLTNKDSKEYRIVKMYTDYFAMSADGYLQVPEQVPEEESAGVKKVGYPEAVEVDSTYETEEQTVTVTDENGREVPTVQEIKKDIPLAMRDAKDESLFPHEPSINDIRQGGLGDCYLLAGLASLGNVNPQFIKDCMRDNGDGTVTVRFYNKAEQPATDGTAQAPVTETRYVRVPKTVPQDDKFAKGSLWVQMIEKAYAASGLHNNAGNAPGFKPRYEDIAGGYSADFLFTLTGKEKTVIHSHGRTESKKLYMDLLFERAIAHYGGKYTDILKDTTRGAGALGGNPALVIAREFLGEKSALRQLTPEELRLPQDERDALMRSLRKERAVRDSLAFMQSQSPAQSPIEEIIKRESRYGALEAFIKTIKTSIDAAGKSKKDPSKTVSYYSDVLRQEDIEEIIEKADFSALSDDLFTAKEKTTIKSRLAKRFAKATGIPVIHRAFSGKYSKAAVDMYNKIEEALKRGGMVTADTITYKPKEIDGADGLNNEHLSGGIAQSHAYTVLGVETRGEHRLVRLRNPWALGTVLYSRKGRTRETERTLGYEDNEGIFLMELNDFAAAFGNITTN
ncbi:MAG: hypothetical protein LBK57_03870 [Clostridiales Family XIII bacterium]|jgi:hypothetical protein|nr:hypothetical protein [Clostridiales Family XIII bacterium]